MSTLWIEEYSQIRADQNGHPADVPHIQTGRTQLSYTGTSVRTSFDFDANTTYVIVYADANSYIVFGDSAAVSDQNGTYLPARTFRSFGINGETRLAVVEEGET